MHFKHLNHANQSYFDHFVDSIRYSGKALKACFFFTVHAFYPDWYISNGSSRIKELNDLLQDKISKISQQNKLQQEQLKIII